jgi:hypothetical protein
MDKRAWGFLGLGDVVAGSPALSDVVGPALLGLGVGAGGRSLKQLYDVYRGKNRPPVIPAMPQSSTKIPVTVTPEEAAQLEAGGVSVKHASEGFLPGVVAGLSAVPGAYLGWQGMDSMFGAQRKALAKAKLDKTRARLEGLLNDSPVQADAPLHAAMKVAEDQAFNKQAGSFGYPLGFPLGMGMAMMGLSAFNHARSDDRYKNTVGALKNYLAQQQEQPSQVELEPVLAAQPKEQEKPLAALGQKVARVLSA